MTPALRRLLLVERGELGTKEHPAGTNKVKYNTAYYGRPVKNVGHTNYAWCVVFQWWCFQRAGIPTSIFPRSASVFAVRDWYKKQHLFDRKPTVGSLAIFSFSHIGLVVKVNRDGSVHTIEGNTDARGGRTGGMVMLKSRSRDIEGFCHPQYQKVRAPAAVPAATPKPRPKAKPAPKPVAKPVPKPVAKPVPKPMAKPMAKPAPAPVAEPVVVSVGPAPPRPRAPYTSVQASGVTVRAGRTTTVQFSAASANTGGFWVPPVGRKRGYSVARGPGVFIADVTVEAPELPADGRLDLRLVETDPADHYKVVKIHPAGELGPSAGGRTRQVTTLSSIGAGNHLWLQLTSSEPIVLPSVTADVVLLRS